MSKKMTFQKDQNPTSLYEKWGFLIGPFYPPSMGLIDIMDIIKNDYNKHKFLSNRNQFQSPLTCS